MIEYGDHLRPLLEAKIGPITPDSITFARVVRGEYVCMVALGNWRHGDIEIMGAATSGGVSRGFIRHIAAYVFDVLDCHHVTAKVKVSNTASIRIMERLRFQREGLLRKADDGEDVVAFGLIREDMQQ